MNDVIVFDQLVKQFGQKTVLDHVSLSVPRGRVIGLVGTNGAGKSTLIKCLLGLLKPTSGRCELLGEDAWTLSDTAKERFGYVPQEVQLYPWMRVKHLVRYVGAFYRNWDQARAEELLDRWELPRDDRFAPLSTGQKQKLAIVLALAHRPDVLILDEPVASLDPVARRLFLESILEIVEDEQHTVLFSTHITSDLERVASHVAILQEGRIVYNDDLDTLKERVKRLRIESRADLPASFAIAGALRSEVRGRNALVAVSQVDDALLDDVAQRWQATVEVEDLNLEEIFLEMHEKSGAR